MRRVAAISASALTALALAGVAAQAHPAEPTLRSEAPRDLKIGSAVWGQRDLLDHDPENAGEFQPILGAEFSSLTPENDMKWAEVHPERDVYDFSGADAVVAFAKANGQEVRGHTLLWHSQNPQWVIDASATWTCQEARDVLEDHVRTVVGRYAGEIYEWDVANDLAMFEAGGENSGHLDAEPPQGLDMDWADEPAADDCGFQRSRHASCSPVSSLGAHSTSGSA
jgi:endo-1,4-beta-xylanase